MEKRSKDMKVVITGMGVVTPYGVGIHNMLEGILYDKDITTTTSLKTTSRMYRDIPIRLVPEFGEDTSHHTKGMKYAIKAVEEALSMSGTKGLKPTRVGVSISSSTPSMPLASHIVHSIDNEPRVLRSSMMLESLNNAVATTIAHKHQFLGACIASSSACASGIQSIIAGIQTILTGKADMMVCGSTDEYSDFLAFMFHKLGLLGSSCKPFHKDRDGIIVGEGSGIVILESEEHAKNRNAHILAYIDDYHQSVSNNSGFSDHDTILSDMMSVYNKNISVPLVINAHATGTVTGDREEAYAITNFYYRNRYFYNTPTIVTTYKQYLGHTMSGSGVIELIASIAQSKNFTFPRIQFPEPTVHDASMYSLNYYKSFPSDRVYIIKHSFGLGGTDSLVSLIVNNS